MGPQCMSSHKTIMVITGRAKKKPNNDPLYIHKHLNLPQNTLRDLPKSISKIISDTFSNEDIFKNHIPIYQQALKNSGFNNNLTYSKSQHSSYSHIQEKWEKRHHSRSMLKHILEK